MDVARLERWGPAGAVAAAVVSSSLLVAALGMSWWSARRGLPVPGINPSEFVVGALNPAVGALVVARHPRNAAGWVLVGGGLAGVAAAARQYVIVAQVSGNLGAPLVDPATWLASWMFVGFWLQPGLLPLLFPDGRTSSPRWRLVARSLLALVVVGAFAAAFRPDPDVEDLGLANPLGIGSSLLPFVVVMGVSAFGSILGGGILGIVSLVARVRVAVGRRRAQLQWLLLGFTAATALATLSLLATDPLDERLFTAAFACIPLSVAIAVVRHGMLDIELVVSRAVAFGFLTAVGVGAYATIVAAVGWRAGLDLPAAIVAAAVALAAASARTRVQRLIDRRLFGVRNDPYAVIAAVGAQIAEAATPARALEQLAAALRESLRRPAVQIVAVGEPLPAWPDLHEFPVTWQGQRLGTLVVGAQRAGERLLAGEQAALQEVARHAGSLLHASGLTTDLQRSRERLVTAREEERRRLRRDLHDGLGPALAGVALGLDGLRDRVQADPNLHERAERLATQVRDAVVEVRTIVDGLRPVSLDELGLAGALGRLETDEGSTSAVVVAVAEPLPPLPAAVEVAALRIAAEAVTNAVRHGSPTRVQVTAAVADGDLRLSVVDDGTGFGARSVDGAGLHNMHERAIEVGGQLVVDSRPGGGTRVDATLPLEPR